MLNDFKMNNKKSKRLTSQNGCEKHKLQGSIKKYCTEKKINKKKHCKTIRKVEYLRNTNIQNSIVSPQKVLNNNKRKKSLMKDHNDTTLYEIKPLSPTKLSISVKKFYNNNSYKRYEENLHSRNENETHIKEKMTIDNNKSIKHLSNLKESTILNGVKTPTPIKKKLKNGKILKSYELIPLLNKEKCKKNKNSNNKSKFMEVIDRGCNFENDKLHMISPPSQISNKTQTNEYLVEEYQVTQSTISTLSISVKRFYKSSTPIKTTNDYENINKDMPLISDTTFNSKADFNYSPLSSKLNSSHKISLNVKHINDASNDKQQKVTAFFPIRRSARKTKNVVNEEKQIALEKAVISQNEDGLKVTIFPNKGRGVIADRDFARGEFVVEYAGDLVCFQEARKREAIYSQDTSTGCYMYYFKYGSIHYCIDATAESSRLGRLVNHSRFGNLGPKVIEISGLPRIVLIAKTDIKRGEELTYDYGDRSKTSLINHPWLAY